MRGSLAEIGQVLSSALALGAATACIVRSVRSSRQRPAWLSLAIGLICWSAGAALDVFATGDTAADFPGPGDGIAFLFYPAAVIALAFFALEAPPRARRSGLLDAGICALAAAAAAAAVAFRADALTAQASTTQLVYSTGDLAVIAAVVVTFALTGWRPGRPVFLVGAGILTVAFADAAHPHQAGTGLVEDGLLVAAWPLAWLLVAWGALSRSRAVGRARAAYRRVVLLPIAFAALATAVLVVDRVDGAGTLAVALAIAALIATAARPAFGYSENERVLARSRHQAMTDSLTGVWNRRRLMTDLQQRIRAADSSSAHVLILFDLDGFKQYNDTFGHPAGDALLARLGANLQKAVGPYGDVYRMGGDEFCVLLGTGTASARTLTSIAAAALSERGEGFTVKSSYGAVLLPQEARDPALALRIADQRMYVQKEKRRPSPSRQTRDTLVQALRERDPELSEHMSAVAELSRRVGQRLKLLPEELDETVRAAELHDVGKMAIPDAILHKPGPLDPEEREFVHKHTIIGERILGAAPALLPVAKVVRATHERWDGQGYPDGLDGESIPIGARIVSACDAFHAMTAVRPYGSTMTVDEAISELSRAAGREFDPRVVDALVQVISDAKAITAPASSEASPP